MATQATYCVTAYVFITLWIFYPLRRYLQASTSLILGCLVIPWVSCGSLIDAIRICVYQGDF